MTPRSNNSDVPENTRYASFGMNYTSFITGLEGVTNASRSDLRSIEKVCASLDFYLRKGDIRGAQMVLDSFLDGYQYDRTGDCSDIPELLKDLIRAASSKIYDLDRYIKSKNAAQRVELLEAMARVDAIMRGK